MKRLIHFLVLKGLILTLYTISCAQNPELVVQTGHTDWVFSVVFSADGKTVASGADDNTIKLWDVKTGQEMKTLSGHTDRIISLAFSSDSKTLASGSLDGTIKLWDVISGRESKTIIGLGGPVFSVAFAPDGKTLLSAGPADTIIVWDIETGLELKTFYDPTAQPSSMEFSADGKTLLSHNGDFKTVKLWDVATTRELRTISVSDTILGSVAISSNGKLLAVAETNRYDTRPQMTPQDLADIKRRSIHSLKLIDVATGQELWALRGLTFFTGAMAFSPDGKFLASVNNRDAGGIIKLWDVVTGREIKEFVGHTANIHSLAFSPDGKLLVSGSSNNTIKLWDISTGQEIRTLAGQVSQITRVAISSDGKRLAWGSYDGTIKLWDVTSGQEVKKLPGHTRKLPSGIPNHINALLFSSDNKTLISRSFDDSLKLWDVSSGQELKAFDGVYTFALSPDGKTIAINRYGDEGGKIRLLDATTGQELKAWIAHPYLLMALAFSSDGKMLASGCIDTIKIWDVATKRELKTLTGHNRWVISLAFSINGDTLASGASSLEGNNSTELDTIKIWDVATGRELKTLRGHMSSVNSVTFSPDGKTLASRGREYSRDVIKLWDVATGRNLETLESSLHKTTLRVHSIVPGFYNNIAYDPVSGDGKFQVKNGINGSLDLLEFKTGRLLASTFAFVGEDWAVVTPDGLFDGSPAAWNRMIWRFNNNAFNYAPVEAFFSDFYYPGLLTDILIGKQPKAPSDISRRDRRQPHLKLTLANAQPSALLTTRNITVKVDIAQTPAGARDVRLFRNGSLIKVWRGDVLKRRSSVTLETTFPIIAGENRLTAYAFNHDNVKSSDATLTIYGAEVLKRQGTAYILAVGVNSYSNPQYNLRYAVADAEAFSAEVKRQQEILKNYARVEVISLSDGQATKANIIESLARLSRRMQPEDAVIVYFAGHGTAQQNRFYLIPHDLGYSGERTQLDEAGLRAILAHSISDRELEQAFEKIDAGQILLVIDACNSGQALEAEEKRRGPMNSKGLAQLAYEKGMYILTAAQSYQAAKEASRFGHGYLTYALVIEGLRDGAADDAPGDGTVFIREWLDYAMRRVPQMQLEKLREARELGTDFSFVEGEARDLTPEKKEVQRPRVFYRREIEAKPLIVARPRATQTSTFGFSPAAKRSVAQLWRRS